MGMTFLFVIIAIGWAVLGAMKTAAEKAGQSAPRKTARPLENVRQAQTVKHNTDQSPIPTEQNSLKMEDTLPDFGDVSTDVQDVQKAQSPFIERIPMQSMEAHHDKKVHLKPLLTGERLAESIILAELLDKPRAMRPHPLTKQQNMPQRRG
ncbi:MAG: hypothetical protein ACO1OC_05490 [Tuberibacillus sp.]